MAVNVGTLKLTVMWADALYDGTSRLWYDEWDNWMETPIVDFSGFGGLWFVRCQITTNARITNATEGGVWR